MRSSGPPDAAGLGPARQRVIHRLAVVDGLVISDDQQPSTQQERAATGDYNVHRMSKRSRFLHTPIEPFTVDAGLTADQILARMEWPFRYLEAVTEAPTIRPDGTILDVPGWDAETGILFEPIPAHLMAMVRDGGLLPHLEKRLKCRTTS